MHPHFLHAAAHRPGVAAMAERQAPQPGVDPGDRAPVAQAANPALERGALDDFDHAVTVICGSQTVKDGIARVAARPSRSGSAKVRSPGVGHGPIRRRPGAVRTGSEEVSCPVLGPAPGTGAADSRFCLRNAGYTVLHAAPDFATAFIETVVRAATGIARSRRAERRRVVALVRAPESLTL